MTIERGKIGETVLSSELTLNGMCESTMQVKDGGMLYLNGTVVGLLTVHPGGTALIRGTAAGGVINAGGKVEIWGLVNGGLVREHGETVVRPGRLVGGILGDWSRVG